MSSFGKKTRSPGFISGDHWLQCDRCGFDIYASTAQKEWSGAVVCTECFETRHPQDLLKAVPERIAPTGLIRSEPEDKFTSVAYCVREAIAGLAVAGCSVASVGSGVPLPPADTL